LPQGADSILLGALPLRAHSPAQATPVELVLYKFDACPYCRKVMRVIDRLGISVSYRDTDADPEAWAELERIGGHDQVPCLLVDGKPMYESEVIVAYLERRFAPAG
jgi:glutathione S-transferase